MIQYAVEHYDLVDDAIWTFGVHSMGSDSNWLVKESTKLFCAKIPDFCFKWSDSWMNSNSETDDPEIFKLS